jgi:hypothetical protein
MEHNRLLAVVVFRGRSLAVTRETLNFSLTSIYTISLFGSSIDVWRAALLGALWAIVFSVVYLWTFL